MRRPRTSSLRSQTLAMAVDTGPAPGRYLLTSVLFLGGARADPHSPGLRLDLAGISE